MWYQCIVYFGGRGWALFFQEARRHVLFLGLARSIHGLEDLMLVTKLLQLSLKKVFSQFLNFVEALKDLLIGIYTITERVKVFLRQICGWKHRWRL